MSKMCQFVGGSNTSLASFGRFCLVLLWSCRLLQERPIENGDEADDILSCKPEIGKCPDGLKENTTFFFGCGGGVFSLGGNHIGQNM